MEDARFTALGISGSGKTCYVLGMYYEMCIGVRGFTLATQNSTSGKLDRWMDKIDDEIGQDRFPAGTDTTTVDDYRFSLAYKGESIMAFDWLDYAGGMLQGKEEGSSVFQDIQNSINASAALYLFIDGETLRHEEYDDKKRSVGRKLRKITNYVNKFSDETGRALPPVVVVVTKSDLCAPYLKAGELPKLVGELINSAEDIYVTMVSLGNEIADDDYSGEVAPINIQTPFFIGIYHEFLNRCIGLKQQILIADENSRSIISQSQMGNAAIANRGFLSRLLNGDGSADMAWNNSQIVEAQRCIEQNKQLLSKYKRLMRIVSTELTKQHAKGAFSLIHNGRELEDFEEPKEVSMFLDD